jgi:hypothetical protein
MSVGSAPVSPAGADPFRPANRTQQLKLLVLSELGQSHSELRTLLVTCILQLHVD